MDYWDRDGKTGLWTAILLPVRTVRTLLSDAPSSALDWCSYDERAHSESRTGPITSARALCYVMKKDRRFFLERRTNLFVKAHDSAEIVAA